MARAIKSTTAHAGNIGDWLEPLGRIGFATKGVVYALIGILAFGAATNTGGSTEGTRGAILSFADGPFGQILLGLVTVGFFGYALWRFLEALVDPYDAGSDAKAIARRVGYAVSGLIYLGLAVWCAWLVLGNGGGNAGGGGSAGQEWTAKILAQPFGQLAVGVAGAIVAGVGLYHFYRAYRSSFMKRYRTSSMSASQRQWVERLGKFGLSARGVAFCIIGGFLIQAALEADPSETRGLSGALDALGAQPYGPWLLGVVALGFVAYGLHCAAQARFSHFDL